MLLPERVELLGSAPWVSGDIRAEALRDAAASIFRQRQPERMPARQHGQQTGEAAACIIRGERPGRATCAGVAIGGMLWWLFLGFVVSRFKDRVSERALARIGRWTGVLIAAFGFALLMEALG